MADVIDDDTLAAVERAWKGDPDLGGIVTRPPEAGRLKSLRDRPQVMPYAHLSCEMADRTPANAAGGAVTWFDRRKVTITVYGTKAQATAALAQVARVFKLGTVLVYPSGARFLIWWPVDGGTLVQDETTKEGTDVWQGVVTAMVKSARSG